jgi:predicted ester cyclase
MTNPSELVRGFYAHIDATGGDFSALEEHIDVRFRFHQPGVVEAQDVDGFRTFVRNFYAAFPDLTHHVSFQFAAGGRVATRMTVTGTQKGPFLGLPATQKEASFTVNSICTVERGKLTDYWLEGDLLGLMRQLQSAA